MKNKLTVLALFTLFAFSVSFAQTPTPANAATSISIATTAVSWTAFNETSVDGPYDVEFNGTDNTYGTSVSSSLNQAGLSFIFGGPALVNNTTYYWRVRDADNDDITVGLQPGAWHQFSFSTIPVPPTIIAPSPANFSVGVSILPQFAWTGSVGVTDYDFEISLTSGGAPIVLSPAYADGVTNTHNFSFVTTASTVLTNGTTYYWRVRQTTPSGTSAWASREFVAVNAAKPTINPIYPGVTSAYIGWYPVPYSSGLKYDVLKSTNTDMTGFTTVASGLTNTYYTVTGLVQGTNYYVQIRATNSDGSKIISYSAVSPSFTPAGPPVPTASYPTNNADDGDIYANPPTLFWYIEGNEPGLTYNIEYIDVTLGETFTTTPDITGITKTFKKLTTNLVAGHTYKWKVQSVAGAVTSAWSAEATFIMYSNVATSAIVPTPSWPVGNATVYSNPPTLYWYLGSDKTGLYYEVELSLDGLVGGPNNAFTTPIVVAGWSQDLFKALPTSLIPNQHYYWHVRSAMTNVGGGASNWSSNADFTIAPTASGAATTPIPSWPIGGAIVDGTMADITLSWTAYSTQALDFKVRIATSASVDGSGALNHGSYAEGGWVSTTTSANANSIKALTAGATYYWQVKSRLTSSTSLESPWSMIASFSTAAGASSVVPLVVSPNYLQPINNTTAILTWNIPVPTESHLKYDLQYSKNENFSGAVSKTNLNEPIAQISGLESNSTYYWRVLSKNDFGSVSNYSATGSFKTSGTTAVEEEVIPTTFELSQNYPNPFNPTTRISYALPQNAFVSIKVYDMLGREVRSLINNEMLAGKHSVEWSGEDNVGNKVASGAYIYRISAGNFVSTKKMILIK